MHSPSPEMQGALSVGTQGPPSVRADELLQAWMLLIFVFVALVPALAAASGWEASVGGTILLAVVCIRFAPHAALSPEDQERRDLWSGGIWGAAIPLLPFLGRFGIVIVSLGMVALLGVGRVPRRGLLWIVPLAALFAGSVLCEVFRYAPDYFQAVGVYDLQRLRSSLGWFLQVHAHTWRPLSHLLTFGLVVVLFESIPPVLKGVRGGLSLGVVCAALITIAQFLSPTIFTLASQTQFWSAINRLSGTFSDPNAQGIFLAIAPFLMVLKGSASRAWRSCSVCFVAVLLATAGLLSGSRSFVLAVLLGVLAGGWMISRRTVLTLVLAGCGAIALLSMLDLYTPWIEALASSSFMPEGAKRVLMSCSVIRAADSFFSRGVFFTIGREIFEYYPIFGVGIDQFRHYVPAVVARLGLNIGTWVDNSNNFYLGLLSELGLLGTVVFILTVRGRTLSTEGVGLCRAGLLVLSVILLTGPHLDFPEVLFLAMGLVAVATRPRHVGVVYPLALGSVSLVIGMVGVFTREQGGYAWEARQGRFDQWLSPAAHIPVACSCDGYARVVMESSYVPSSAPVTVSIMSSTGEFQEIAFTRAEPRQLSFSCLNSSTSPRDRYPGKIDLSIVTTPGWSPARAWPERSSDSRILGVAIKGRRWEDLLRPEPCPLIAVP